MLRLLALRLAAAAAILVVMSFLVFALIAAMPGDPLDATLASDPGLTSADVARLKRLHGADQPLTTRYANWAGAIFRGDSGYSRLYAARAADVLWPHLGRSLLLLVPSLVLGLALAVPLGVAAAARPDGVVDRTVMALAALAQAAPSFWIGLALMILFAVHLGWLPAGGIGEAEPLDRLRHMVLPVATLAIVTAGSLVRYVRAAMREALGALYIRSARAKGAGRSRVLLHHGLRNALLPLAALLGLEIGGLVSGALVVETLFAWPGMGKLTYDAVMGNDYNLAALGRLVATAATLLGSLLADLSAQWLDPRLGHAL